MNKIQTKNKKRKKEKSKSKEQLILNNNQKDIEQYKIYEKK